MQVDVPTFLISLAVSTVVGALVFFGLVLKLEKMKTELINKVTTETVDSHNDRSIYCISGNNNKTK